jgi:hypothetical protein
MKPILSFLLLPLLALQACHKEEKEIVRFPYEQYYQLRYDAPSDSFFATADFMVQYQYTTYGSIELAADESIRLNGMASMYPFYGGYAWKGKGIPDAVFTLTKKDKTLTNTIKASGMQVYSFTGIADTVSVSALKSLKWTGPARKNNESFYVGIQFSDNTVHSFGPTITADSVALPAGFFTGRPTGKTKLTVQWIGSAGELQMSDQGKSGNMFCTSTNMKEIWLKP